MSYHMATKSHVLSRRVQSFKWSRILCRQINGSQIMPRSFDGYASGDGDSDINDGYIILPHRGENINDYILDVNSEEIPSDWYTTNKREYES